MLAYIVRRLGYALVMIVLVSFVSFLIIELPPGDFLTQKLMELQTQGDRSAALRIDEYRARYGLDKPLLERYWIWASNFIKGDFGESFEYERPVKDLLGERITMTLILALTTLVISYTIAIVGGVYSATHQYSGGDQIITVLAFLGLGTPGFLLALIVLFVAVVILKQDIGGLFSREFQDAPWSLPRVWDLIKHLWIPAFIGAAASAPAWLRIMRGNMLEILGQPFIEAARARGLKNKTVTWRHAVRVAINPMVVILGSEALPSLIGGNALVAIVLGLPTVGPLYVDALQKQDMYMAGTILVFMVMLMLVGNLLADLALVWLDPRIRLD